MTLPFRFQHCPVIFLLDLRGIIEKCVQMKVPKVAEVLLQYTPKDQTPIAL